MTSSEFKIGDIVKNRAWPEFGLGRVLGPDPYDPTGLAVEFENETLATHDCGGLGRENYCWFSWVDHLELVLRPGDLVSGETKLRITGETKWGHHFGTDAVVTFRALWGFGVDATNDKGLSQLIHPDDFEVIKEVPKAAKKARTFDLNSQVGRILAHLLAGNSLTPLQAFGVFGTFRLAARIKELRDAGHKIKTVMKRDPTGRPYAEYSLRNAGRFL